MHSLTKQILENRKKRDPVDDLGLPLSKDNDEGSIKNPQYFVARALLFEKLDPRYDEDSIHRLHLRQGIIHYNNEEIIEDRKSFFRLTGVSYPVSDQVQMRFWIELKRRLPHLNPNIYKVTDGLWWDKKNGKIVEGSSQDIREKARKGEYGEEW